MAYFHVPQLRVYKAIKCFPHQTAAEVIPEAISKIMRLTTAAGQEMLDRPIEEFVLKVRCEPLLVVGCWLLLVVVEPSAPVQVVGRSEFVLNPSMALHKLVCVRELINRWQKLEFIIMFREDLRELEDNHDQALVDMEEVVRKQQEKVYPIYELDSLFLMKVVSLTRFRDKVWRGGGCGCALVGVSPTWPGRTWRCLWSAPSCPTAPCIWSAGCTLGAAASAPSCAPARACRPCGTSRSALVIVCAFPIPEWGSCVCACNTLNPC